MTPFLEDLRRGKPLHGDVEQGQHASCRQPLSRLQAAVIKSQSELDTQNLHVPLPRERLHLVLAPSFSSFQRSFPVGHMFIHRPGERCGSLPLHHSPSAAVNSSKRQADISPHPQKHFKWPSKLPTGFIVHSFDDLKKYVSWSSGVL